MAVLPSAEIKYRSGAVFYPFRQESNFLYLTGFSEPNSLAVIRKTGPGMGDYTFHLFCRPKDPYAEQWSGPWSGLQAAEDVFNADEACDINQLTALLPSLIRDATVIVTDFSTSESKSPLMAAFRTSFPTKNTPITPLTPLINPLRAIKSPAEIAVMRHAGMVSGRAITQAMRRPWSTEKDLESYLSYAFTQHNLSGPAYVPVVAGGRRGCMIHYVHNNALLEQDEMILVDAGGEYGWYITDITRTWPASGKFSAAQRDLYSAVLVAQREGIKMCREQLGMSLDEIHRATEAILETELEKLGFDFGLGKGMFGKGGDLMGTLFPHHVGHYIGLDVHDVPGYPRSLPLRAGHCVTIEPGVYVPNDEAFPKHFRGLAVRIEDSVCVGENECIVLTAEAAKEVEDIEALR